MAVTLFQVVGVSFAQCESNAAGPMLQLRM